MTIAKKEFVSVEFAPTITLSAILSGIPFSVAKMRLAETLTWEGVGSAGIC